MHLQCETLVHTAGMLLVKFGPTRFVDDGIRNYYNKAGQSKKFLIGDAAFFEVKVAESMFKFKVLHNIFIRFYKQLPDEDGLTYTIKLKSPEFGITDMRFTCDDGTWHHLFEKCNHKDEIHSEHHSFITYEKFIRCVYTFSIELTIDVIFKEKIIAKLHEDCDLTDFELRGVDGSVPIHKAVLAAASPVLHEMLTGPWKEVKKDYLDVDVTKAVLDNFKSNLYLGTLPDSGSEELLLLASRHMKAELEVIRDMKAAREEEIVKVIDPSPTPTAELEEIRDTKSGYKYKRREKKEVKEIVAPTPRPQPKTARKLRAEARAKRAAAAAANAEGASCTKRPRQR